jgi:transcriptional regulator NrdR family protein
MPASQVPCVECGSVLTSVVSTSKLRNGLIVRRRRCRTCDHKWYTEQAPEIVLSPYRLIWNGRKVFALKDDV